jgi:hypothetical protein
LVIVLVADDFLIAGVMPTRPIAENPLKSMLYSLATHCHRSALEIFGTINCANRKRWLAHWHSGKSLFQPATLNRQRPRPKAVETTDFRPKALKLFKSSLGRTPKVNFGKTNRNQPSRLLRKALISPKAEVQNPSSERNPNTEARK